MTAVPLEAVRTFRLRQRLERAVETAIAALDALDADTEDLEDGHDRERVDEREPEAGDKAQVVGCILNPHGA